MRKLLLALSVSALLGGCGLIYKVDVYQGSLLEKRNVEQLKPGLTKRQVYALLGSPSVSDPFHADRWDYVASESHRGSDPDIKNLILTFEGDVLATVEGDYFPEQDDALALKMRRYGNLPRDKEKDRRGATRR